MPTPSQSGVNQTRAPSRSPWYVYRETSKATESGEADDRLPKMLRRMPMRVTPPNIIIRLHGVQALVHGVNPGRRGHHIQDRQQKSKGVPIARNSIGGPREGACHRASEN